MRRPILWLSLIVGFVLFLAYGAYPPSTELKLGKDLRGGVALTYAVESVPGSDPRETMRRLIEVLKNRIDPNNQLDITFTPQGTDRLEITMPLPNDRVRELRAAFEAELAKVGAGVRIGDVDDLLSLPPQEREDRIAQLVGGDEPLANKIRAFLEASERSVSARSRYDAVVSELASARASGATDEDVAPLLTERDTLAAEVAEAEQARDDAREAVQSSVFHPEDLREALEESDQEIRKKDEHKNELVVIPSPRDEALAAIREAFPDRTEAIERAIAAYETYNEQRQTLDDPSDLKRLLQGAGVLDFRITVNSREHPEERRLRAELLEKGPRNVESIDTGWYRIQQLDNWYDSIEELAMLKENPAGFFQARGFVVEKFGGGYYMLCWDTPGKRLTSAEGDWQVSSAMLGTDSFGRPAINFRMDPRGAQLLGKLTRENLQQQMAVILDDQVITAPTLQGAISSQGQITGDFSPAETTYVIRTLNAGSLQSRLSPNPIAENTIGPSLGLDNLRKGATAGLIALVVIGVFMVIYYFPTCGGVAVFSLLCNAALLLGWMAANGWVFTLPGIAGIILTFGMAVDANVLIYERMREEMYRGEDLRNSVRLGYSKAMSSIIDGNVTNLIVCFVLGMVGTQEIKGFALTLGTGVVTTMFCSLIISRLMFAVLVDRIHVRKLSMLPMAVPVIEKTLSPKVNWLGFRNFFIVVSSIYVALGLGMVVFQGPEMLDIEFRAGTQITMEMKEGANLTRPDVEARVHAIGSREGVKESLLPLRAADVDVINPGADGVTSRIFQVKSGVIDKDAMVDALSEEFEAELDTRPAMTAEGFGVSDTRRARAEHVFPIVYSTLGRNIDAPGFDPARHQRSTREWLGGGVILLRNIEPPVSEEEIASRIARMREQPDFSAVTGNRWEVVTLEGTRDRATAAAILFLDDSLKFSQDPSAWTTDVAAVEWELAEAALSKPPTFASVVSFSPAIAGEFRAKGVTAVLLSFILITIYIWVRFGSIRYSLAAIVCLLHDVLTAIGLIALAEVLWDTSWARGLIEPLGIRPFKINLDMIAALLTIIGYSLNDTIIVMDRVRENKGRLPFATDATINRSINETISRTVITSGTTLMAVLIMFMFGGLGVRGFSYALLIGIGVGTYSSIAVAAPLVRQRVSGALPQGPSSGSGPGSDTPTQGPETRTE